MHDQMLKDILRRLNTLERTSARLRIGEVTDVNPLDVALGGSDVSYEDVKAVDGLRLDAADQIAALLAGNDLLVLGRIGDGRGSVTGLSTVTWPGATPTSSTLTVTHGGDFGAGTPGIVLATPAGVGGSQYTVVTQVISGTQFTAVMRDMTGSPVNGSTRSFYWLATA